ncbi:MAG: radical SAM protein [Thermoplasmata archaeon]|nr:radical SAM protein [Thermoplasmata archaeon]
MGSLSRYFSILEGQSRPGFHSVKDFRIDFDPTAEPEELWHLHGKAMEHMKAGKSGKGGMNLLDLKIALAGRMMDSCTLCERRCRADRNAGKRGKCNVLEARITSEFMHYGEEPELVPSYTIFFSGCTFECVYCQNYDISQFSSVGEFHSPETVAGMIDRRRGRNVNWVGGDPTSNLPYILEVLAHTDARLPQVWNSNMYLTPESMKLLDGIVDVYLTDFKYGNNDCARRFSKVERYWEIITRNHRFARQQSEVMIRHLVLPNHVECCSKPVLKWIASNLENVRVNVMAQYRPMYQAAEYQDIKGPLRTLEFMEAREHALALGLELVE